MWRWARSSGSLCKGASVTPQHAALDGPCLDRVCWCGCVRPALRRPGAASGNHEEHEKHEQDQMIMLGGPDRAYVLFVFFVVKQPRGVTAMPARSRGRFAQIRAQERRR